MLADNLLEMNQNISHMCNQSKKNNKKSYLKVGGTNIWSEDRTYSHS